MPRRGRQPSLFWFFMKSLTFLLSVGLALWLFGFLGQSERRERVLGRMERVSDKLLSKVESVLDSRGAAKSATREKRKSGTDSVAVGVAEEMGGSLGEKVGFSAPLLADSTQTLAVFCSDWRFTEASRQFISSSLGFETFNEIVIPGGPGTSIYHYQKPRDVDFFRDAVETLQKAKGIRSAVIISHEDCGYYKEVFPAVPDARSVQEEELRKAAEKLRAMHIEDVRPFYMILNDGSAEFVQVR